MKKIFCLIITLGLLVLAGPLCAAGVSPMTNVWGLPNWVTNFEIRGAGTAAAPSLTVGTVGLWSPGTKILATDSDIRILSDSKKLRLGAGEDDFTIAFDGTRGTLDLASNTLWIKTGYFTLFNGWTGEHMIDAAGNGGVTLFHNGVSKFWSSANSWTAVAATSADTLANGQYCIHFDGTQQMIVTMKVGDSTYTYTTAHD